MRRWVMPKRISKPTKKAKRPGRKDSNQIAFQTIQKTIELSEDKAPKVDKAMISAVMSALGRKGGRIGGKRRMETMTQEQRSAIASKAARAKWAKKQNH